MPRPILRLFAITALCGVLGCGGNPASPSPVSHVYTGTISGQLTLPTVNYRLVGCPLFVTPSTLIRPNLTCVAQESCVSRSDLQLTAKMTLFENRDGTIVGSSEITGTESIGVCGGAGTQIAPIAISSPVTGSASSLTSGGVAATAQSVPTDFSSPLDVTRTVTLIGALRDGAVSGTLNLKEEFVKRDGLGSNGSGSAAFVTTLR